MVLTQRGSITLAAVLLFGLFPQAFYPRLYISATRIPGTEMGMSDLFGNRFTDSKRIKGTIPEMLQKTLDFVRNNMHVSTGIDPLTGKRIDIVLIPYFYSFFEFLNFIGKKLRKKSPRETELPWQDGRLVHWVKPLVEASPEKCKPYR